MAWLYDDLILSDNDVRFYGAFSSNFDDLQFDFCQAKQQTNPETVSPIELIIPELQNGQMYDNISVPPNFGILVSKKLMQIFEKLNISNIQWYQTVIKRNDGKIITKEYYLGNNILAIDAIDFRLSELVLDPDDGSIDFIDKLVIKEDLPEVPAIYRLKEFLPLQIISDELKKAIVSSRCTGIEFLKPEDFKL